MALVLPSYVLIEATIEDPRQFNNFLRENPLPLNDADVEHFISSTRIRHQTLFTILVITELIFAIFFVITLWLSLKP